MLAGGEQLVGSLCKRHVVTPYREVGAPTACRRMVSGSFHSASCGSFHLSFTVLVRYRSPSAYLALPDGAGGFRQGFSGPALLRVPAMKAILRVRGCHPLWPRFPNTFHLHCRQFCRPYNPRGHAPWFGLLRFRSPLLAESLLFSLPPGT
jgi:hypothetical protein